MNVMQGNTIVLRVEFLDSAGALADPVLPTVSLYDPSGTEIVVADALLRDSLGEYHYAYLVAADAATGTWLARYEGSISGATYSTEETFLVYAPGDEPIPGSLVALNELENALGVAPGDVTTQQQDNYRQAIAAASVAVSRYADREFASPVVTETRTFEYDQSGFLDVDDCTAITAVSFSIGGADYALDTYQWSGEPYGGPVYTYITLPERAWTQSPAMGFRNNLDRLYGDRGWQGQVLVKVTATWGWPDVPDDVKRAVIWTAAEMADKPDAMRSEAIAGYSYSRETETLQTSSGAIPQRAKELLDPYVRVKVA